MFHGSSEDYRLVVEPLYREEATKLIQEVYRLYFKLKRLDANKKLELAKSPQTITDAELEQLEKDIVDTRHKLHACRKKSFRKLQEPEEQSYLGELVRSIKDKNYEQIDYSEPEFTRYLFAALRKDLINHEEMLTAKLMYESLIAFNQGKVPANPQAQFSQFNLGDSDGPYDPSQDISYWTSENSQQLAASTGDKQYYTINLPHQVAVKYLYMRLQDMRISEQLGRYLIAYINSKSCRQSQKNKAIAAVNAFNGFNNESVRKVNAKLLQKFIRQHEAESINLFLDDTDYSGMQESEIPEYVSQLADARFMKSFDRLANGMPMLCVSPQRIDGKPASPVLSFVLPTISTFNNLQNIVHGAEATIPVAVAGQENVRMIRAYDEIPSLADGEKSQIQQNLELLTPTAGRLSKHARPIEVTHPDADKTDKPHGSDCHDFLLTWHDLFHAWRNGSNYKALIRRLRVLHDEKAGLAKDPNGMSKVLWKLTDLDISQGIWLRKLAKSASSSNLSQDAQKIDIFVGKLYAAGDLDYTCELDDNYLLLYDMTSPENQAIWDYLIPVADMFKNYAKYQSELQSRPYVNLFFEKYRNVAEYRQLNPEASIFEVILHNFLTPAELADDLLIKYLRQLPENDLVYWSKNNGLCFDKSVREKYPDLEWRLRDNSRSKIREFLQAEILESCSVEEDLVALKKEHIELRKTFADWSIENTEYAKWLTIDIDADASIFAYKKSNQKIQRFMEIIDKHKLMLDEYALVGSFLPDVYADEKASFIELLDSNNLELEDDVEVAVLSFGYNLSKEVSTMCQDALIDLKQSFGFGEVDKAMQSYISKLQQELKIIPNALKRTSDLYDEIVRQQQCLKSMKPLMDTVQTYNRELTFFNLFFILLHLNLWIYARIISEAMSKIPVADRSKVMELETDAARKVQAAVQAHSMYLQKTQEMTDQLLSPQNSSVSEPLAGDLDFTAPLGRGLSISVC